MAALRWVRDNISSFGAEALFASKVPLPVIRYKLLLPSAAGSPPLIQMPDSMPVSAFGAGVKTATCASVEAEYAMSQP